MTLVMSGGGHREFEYDMGWTATRFKEEVIKAWLDGKELENDALQTHGVFMHIWIDVWKPGTIVSEEWLKTGKHTMRAFLPSDSRFLRVEVYDRNNANIPWPEERYLVNGRDEKMICPEIVC